jgi:hypothetical protein
MNASPLALMMTMGVLLSSSNNTVCDSSPNRRSSLSRKTPDERKELRSLRKRQRVAKKRGG